MTFAKNHAPCVACGLPARRHREHDFDPDPIWLAALAERDAATDRRIAGYMEALKRERTEWSRLAMMASTRREGAREARTEVRLAWAELRANMSVSEGGPKAMRGVWFRGEDAVAQVQRVDAAIREGTDDAE